VSIHKLRRQLTAANKRVKWYIEHFERFPSTRRRRHAYMRRVAERNNIRWNLEMERARFPVDLEYARADEGLRGFHIPLNFALPRTQEEE
jgi:hypothetical protein